ncbi:MAG: hypothetical protein P8090_02615 [Gammaproteobacteria bacterium]
MDYHCDVCGMTIEKTSGYAYTTTQVATSVGYWKNVFNHPETYGGDGSFIAMTAIPLISHSTPWILCESCSALIDADAGAARQYAARDQEPPGCGPADQRDAMITAGLGWSLLYNEWPMSVQIGEHPVTHDPSKGTRCDFCRRVVCGDEKFGMFAEGVYKDLLAKGVSFIRTPTPQHVVDGTPYWIACATCLERSGAATDGTVLSQRQSTARKGHSGKPWWKFW